MAGLPVNPKVASEKRQLDLPRGWKFERGKEWDGDLSHHVWMPRLYNHNGNRVLFEFVPNDRMAPHEKIIESNVQEMTGKIASKGYYTKFAHVTPIGDDRLMIVDGHHRKESLDRLEGKRTPSLIHSIYSDIKLGTWYPTMGIGQFEKALKNAAPRECRYGAAMERVLAGDAYFAALLPDGRCYSFSCPNRSLEAAFELQGNLLEAAGGVPNGDYVADKKGDVKGALSEGRVVLARKPLKHAEVIGIANEGKVCPPKTTRHGGLADLWLPVLPELFGVENIDVQNKILLYMIGMMASDEHPLGLNNPLRIKKS